MKKTLRLNKIAAAVIAASAVMSAPTHAVNLSDDGLGDVGLVPYYTVRNGIDTYLSIVNTSPRYVVAVKLRFREGDNSRDARDFNIFLSPNDVWVAAITMGEDGETPVVQTNDTSCTAPALSAAAATMEGMRGVAFTSLAYDGNSDVFGADTGSDSIERTQEGHIEVIEMGVADPNDSDLASWAVHPDTKCNLIVDAYSTPDLFNQVYSEPLNVIKVAANIQAITAGASAGLPITMLANFFNPANIEDPDNPDPIDLMREPFSVEPNLNSAFPPVAMQTTNAGNIEDAFLTGVDAVSSLMMATTVINEYAIGGAALAATDWVVNFPTKNFYVDVDEADQVVDGANPFEFYFQNDLDGDGLSCVTVGYGYFDREENFELGDSDVDFSPKPPGAPTSSICQETQTLSFADESVLGSKNDYGVPLAAGFENGWMALRFTQAGSIVSLAGNEYLGLPAVGFSVKVLRNAVVQEGVLRNYTIVTEHAYRREIITPIQ
jgi:hypothetical protein